MLKDLIGALLINRRQQQGFFRFAGNLSAGHKCFHLYWPEPAFAPESGGQNIFRQQNPLAMISSPPLFYQLLKAFKSSL